MYKNNKQAYLDNITDSKKRRTFRTYFGGKNLYLTKISKSKLKKENLMTYQRKKELTLPRMDQAIAWKVDDKLR